MRHVLVSFDGRYLRPSALPDGPPTLTTPPAEPEVTAVWQRVQLPYNRVALRSTDGRFLAYRSDGSTRPRVLTLTDDLGVDEAFEEVLWPDGKISLRSCDLTYLSAPADRDELSADAPSAGLDERFVYVEPPANVLHEVLGARHQPAQVQDMPRQFYETGQMSPPDLDTRKA